MAIVNCTPHDVVLVREDGSHITTIAPEAISARCATTSETVSTVELAGSTLPVSRVAFGEVTGLPAPAEGTFYVVSRIVAEACKGLRNDLLIPDGAVRDGEGRIVGCKGFAVV